MDDIEYNDIKYIIDIFKKYYETIQQPSVDEKEKNKKTNTIRLTQEFNEKLFNKIGKRINITDCSVMKNDIKNYRVLTDIQLKQLYTLTETEKIGIIKTYNIMFSTIENLIN